MPRERAVPLSSERDYIALLYMKLSLYVLCLHNSHSKLSARIRAYMTDFFKLLTRRKTLSVPLLLLVLAAGIWWYTKPVGMGNKNSILAVETTQTKIQAMPVMLQTIGSVQAAQTVSITPQVTATIDKIDFQEGQNVKAGQLLFQLNQTTFSASLSQKQANLAKDLAQYEFDVDQAKRYASLYKTNVVSEEQYEQMQTTAKLQAAIDKNDEAQVIAAKNQLSYTQIHAPIAGKIGNLTVRVGDLLVANNPTPIEVINKMTPVLINFSFPQNELTRIMQEQRNKTLTVSVYTQDGSMKLGSGKLDFVDNAVNPETGTVLLKALVNNKTNNLWPGEFVLVKLILSITPHAIVIPAKAVQMDQQGSFVYRVNNNVVYAQRVKISRQIGDTAVVQQGLNAGETIVTTIPPGLNVGSVVTIASTRTKK